MVVKTADGLSDIIHSGVGVKQGCPLSPILSGLFLDDLERHITALSASACLPTLGCQVIAPFLWADDLVLVATDRNGLQKQLDVLASYSHRWGITVSVAKTKAITFRRPRAAVVLTPPLLYQGTVIEEVDSFVYLGICFHATDSFATAGVQRVQAAERALFAMRSRSAELGLYDPVVQLQLFDALVVPVMMYGAELWGTQYTKSKHPGLDECEKLHMQFLRWVLGVRSSTPKIVMLAETGRFPLRVKMAKLVGNYWNRLVEMEETRPAKWAFRRSAELGREQSGTQSSATASWARQVLSFMTSLGVDLDLAAPSIIDVDALVAAAEAQHFELFLDNGTKKRQYVENFGLPNRESYTAPAAYLQIVQSWPARKRLAQLRTGSHLLQVELGRHQRATTRQCESRVCQRCGSGAVDDASHMVFECEHLARARAKYADLFGQGEGDLGDFFAQPPIRLAAFVLECFEACNVVQWLDEFVNINNQIV
jgi:hypothetical protein